MPHQRVEIGVRLVRNPSEDRYRSRSASHCAGRDQQLVTLPKREAVVDPHRSAPQPSAQAHHGAGFHGTHRALAVFAVDQITPTGADRHWQSGGNSVAP
ncbi:hypothetical protein [Arthrobacter methylotrophus]|uniref:hypothetical protein n=1 Tax=Arthrobacter methylotrophus TaxID=121291 RepID=UPI0031EB406A